MENKLFINICAWCQKEFPKVNSKIEDANRKGEISFSHGICPRHYLNMLKEMGMNDLQIKSKLADAERKGNESLDLEKHPELVDKWSKGIFTETQLKEEEENNKKFVDRFKTLAGLTKNEQ